MSPTPTTGKEAFPAKGGPMELGTRLPKESWITLALSDHEAIFALRLGYSLRRVSTTKTLGVIYWNGLNPLLKSTLKQLFDHWIPVKSLLSSFPSGGSNLDMESLAKLGIWNLDTVEKCVFISPKLLLEQNCDQIFNEPDGTSIGVQEDGGGKGFGPDLFVFRPDKGTLKELLVIGSTQNFGRADEILEHHFGRSANNGIGFLLAQKFKICFEKNIGGAQITEEQEDDKDEGCLVLSPSPTPSLESGSPSDLQVRLQITTSHDDLVQSEVRDPLDNSIAIIGMSCRMPGANDPDEFWHLLKEGRDAITSHPEDRPVSKFHSSLDADIPFIQAGYLKCRVDEFDAKFFSISPREAIYIDPQQRLLLEVTWESLENAGISPMSLKETDTGVFIGIWQQDYVHSLPSIGEDQNEFYHRYLGNAFSATASRISYFLGLRGPNLPLEAGCSSSLGGIHLACQSLRAHESTLALAGGVNIVLLAKIPITDDNIVLSKNFRCKSFDESADGFVRAEGVGMIVLKRYNDAVVDRDNILGCILGSAFNNDGAGTGFGTPNGMAQADVIRKAIKDAGVSSSQISFVEAHGTGTMVGDPTEMWAIGQGYGSSGRGSPLIVSSVKTNIGHAEAAAGIAGLIKVLLCFKHQAIPAHLHLNELNHHIDLESIPARIPTQLEEWRGDDGRPRLAAVSSFGMSGTNVHMILREPPPRVISKPKLNESQLNSEVEDSGQRVFVISAKSEEALDELRLKYVKYLKDHPEVGLTQFSYSCLAGRSHFNHRLVTQMKEKDMLIKHLENNIYKKFRVPSERNKVAFMFTGQGSQYVGMGKALYQESKNFKQALDVIGNLFESKLQRSLKEVLWEDHEALNQVIYCQPALFCVQIAMIQFWHGLGLVPDYVLGHSAGEFPASVAAGVLSVEDAFKLVVSRAQLVATLAEEGKMLAVSSSYEIAQSYLEAFRTNPEDRPEIAAVNSTNETIVAGKPEKITEFADYCKAKGVIVQELKSTHAYHSRSMDIILPKYEEIIKNLNHTPLKEGVIYVSGTKGLVCTSEHDFGVDYWKAHTRNSVKFSEAIKVLQNGGVKAFVEIGPQPILMSLAMANTPEDKLSETHFIPTIRQKEDGFKSCLNFAGRLYFAGVDINWSAWFKDMKTFESSTDELIKLDLPKYAFQRQSYWHDSSAGHNLSEITATGFYSAGPTLHPILGKLFPSSLPGHIYVNGLFLKDVPYIEDHKVGEYIIVPAAAWLETIMAAGRHVLHGEGRPISLCVEDLSVEMPLELPVGGKCQLETLVSSMVLSKDDEERDNVRGRGIKFGVQIYSQDKSGAPDKWKRASHAVVSPCTEALVSNEYQVLDLEALKSSLTEEESIQSAYETVAGMGIKFGQRFRSIVSAWRGGKSEVLTQVDIPGVAQQNPHPSTNLSSTSIPDPRDKNYICHPIVLDAMIQTHVFSLVLGSNSSQSEINRRELLLPIKIGKFTWFSKSLEAESKSLYCHVPPHSTSSNVVVNLYAESGELLGIMEGLEMIQTSLPAFVRALQAANSESLRLNNDIWRPTPYLCPNQARVDLSLMVQPSSKTPCFSAAAAHIKELMSDRLDYIQVTSRIAFLYLVISLQENEWDWPEVGQSIDLSSWRAKLPPQLTNIPKLPDYYATIFRTEGFTKPSDEPGVNPKDHSRDIAIKGLPTVAEAKVEIIQLTQEGYAEFGQGEPGILNTNKFGAKMSRILNGELAPLEALFPESKEDGGAALFYDSIFYNGVCSDNISLTLDAIMVWAGKGHGVLRILEVGGGLAVTTRELIKRLQIHELYFEYVFTDISPLFISKAKETLTDVGIDLKNVKFLPYNIELDPLSQGFSPSYFDLVTGTEVIHATSDICQSLRNLRRVIRPGGALVLCEQFEPIYPVTLTFGILEGWWGYKDFRADSENYSVSPFVDRHTWCRLLQETGYESTIALSTHNIEISGALFARVPELTSQMSLPITSIPSGNVVPTWLIFGDGTVLAHKLKEELEGLCCRKVLVANLKSAAQELTFPSTSEFELNPANLDHFDRILKNIIERQNVILEGIVFMCTGVNVESPETVQPELCGAAFNLFKAIIGHMDAVKPKAQFILITRGVNYLGDTVGGNCNAATVDGLTRTFMNEYDGVRTRTIDLDQGNSSDDSQSVPTEVSELIFHFWVANNERNLCLRDKNKAFIRRFGYEPKTPVPVVLPKADRYEIIPPESRSVSDIEIGPARSFKVSHKKIEVQVRAVALNFRDLFVVLRPEGFSFPGSENWKIGIDIAGIVTAVGEEVKEFKLGDPVVGANFRNHGIASHVLCSEHELIAKPSQLTYAEASTLPAAVLTVVASMGSKIKLEASDRVLIHVATGGVGLVAVQYAKEIGAEIFATAGSERKRKFLRSLGIKHVYHSRNTEFGDAILRDTNQSGVTMVLNSLTAEGFKEASLKACAPGAKFIEIAKVNIWSEEEVRELRSDVQYSVIDLTQYFTDGYDLDEDKMPEDAKKYILEREKLTEELQTRIKNRNVRGLPFVSFALDQIREAFLYFQKAKHIGKVVLLMPELHLSQKGEPQWVNKYFNPESSYIITGGLGGLGLEVAKYMCKSGAQHIVLVGRNPPNQAALEILRGLKESGKNVLVYNTDVSQRSNCEGLLQWMKETELPPMRGIVHAAGVLCDNIIVNQSWQDYEPVFKPKVYGAWHLHSLTLNLEYNLEFFVLFSSVTCLWGNIGQGNHVAANRFLDSLALYRDSMGLPGTTIDWGAWSDVGAAAHVKMNLEACFGIRAFSPAVGIDGFQQILRSKLPQAVFLDFADPSVSKGVLNLGNYLDEIASKTQTNNKGPDEFKRLAAEINSLPPEQRAAKISEYMEKVLRDTLKLPDNEAVDHDMLFSEMGVDSLMAMEMRNRIQPLLNGRSISLSALQENRTIRKLSNYIAEQMNSEENTLTLPEMLELHSTLPKEIEISGSCLPRTLPSKAKHIFLTGATGHMGSHFLPVLTNHPNEFTVHCLIRGGSDEEALKKLLDVLNFYKIRESVNMDRVKIIPGDILDPRLGLKDEGDYKEFSKLIDVVIHFAARANHIEPYEDKGPNAMRHHNVRGLINILRFVVKERVKTILHASSLLAVTSVSSDGILSEDYPDPSEKGEAIKNGYSLTKFVGEQLIRQASQVGVPVLMIRYPYVLGSSETGIMTTEGSYIWRFMTLCMKLGKAPFIDDVGLPLLPVDVAIKVSLRILLNDSSELGVYNFFGETQATQDEIRVMTEAGYKGKTKKLKMEFVKFEEWKRAVLATRDEELLGALAIIMRDNGNQQPSVLTYHPLTRGQKMELESCTLCTNITEKLQRNVPDVRDLLVPVRHLLRKHMDAFMQVNPDSEDESDGEVGN